MRIKLPKRKGKKKKDEFWSGKHGLGEWTPEDKREVNARAVELLASRMNWTIEEAARARELPAKVEVY